MCEKNTNELENIKNCNNCFISDEHKMDCYRQCKSFYDGDTGDTELCRFIHRQKIDKKSESIQNQQQQQQQQPYQHRRKRMDYHLTIQLRNARERNRVRAVNEAFARLRKMIPYTAHRSKRVSKVKTLQKAVQYIAELTMLLKTISEK